MKTLINYEFAEINELLKITFQNHAKFINWKVDQKVFSKSIFSLKKKLVCLMRTEDIPSLEILTL